jgi:hypothetical protein
MPFAPYPTVRNYSPTGPAFARSRDRKNWFIRLVEALHRSRRVQAGRIIARSRHLVRDPTRRENVTGKN